MNLRESVLLAALAILASSARAAVACQVDDAYADFLQRARHAAGATDDVRLAALHDFVTAHRALYTPEAIGIVPGPVLEGKGLREMATAGADSLLPRDLAERAAPLVPVLARELAARLDEVDAATFARFFEGGDASAKARGWPVRSGYYVGYLLADRLARHRTLAELAHLQGPALRREIGEALAALADGH